MNTSNSSARIHLVSREFLLSRIGLPPHKSKSPPILNTLETPVGFLNGLTSSKNSLLASQSFREPKSGLTQCLIIKYWGGFRFKILSRRNSRKRTIDHVAPCSRQYVCCSLRSQQKSSSLSCGSLQSPICMLLPAVATKITFIVCPLYTPLYKPHNSGLVSNEEEANASSSQLKNSSLPSDFQKKPSFHGGVERNNFPETMGCKLVSSPLRLMAGLSTNTKKNDDEAPAAHTKNNINSYWMGGGEELRA